MKQPEMFEIDIDGHGEKSVWIMRGSNKDYAGE